MHLFRAESVNPQLRVYGSLEDLQTLVPAWAELLSSYALSTTFSTWEWLSSWWRAFGGNQQLLVIALFDSGSRLLGLAPLSIATKRMPGGLPLRELRLMGDGSGDSDNLDMPVRPGFEDQFFGAIIECLAIEKRMWDICRLNTLRPDSPAAIKLPNVLMQRGWHVFRYERPASAISLPDTWEAYHQQLSSEDRKNLDRYGRRLTKHFAWRIYRCQEQSQLPVCLEALFRLHQARWLTRGEQGSFASEARRRFYYDLSYELLAHGWLELWVLEIDGTIEAVQYGFRYGNTVFQLQEGFDPARSPDRVGFILRGQVMRNLIMEGVRRYDFLAGEPGYKAHWLAQLGKYVNLHFARPFSLGGTCLRALDDAKRGKEWLRVHVPTEVWEVLHRINAGVRRTARAEVRAPATGRASGEKKARSIGENRDI